MRILYAPSVHQGGGKVLMLMLIRQLSTGRDITWIIDQRLEIPPEYVPAGAIRRVRPSMISRLLTEFHMLSYDRNTSLLCFGNLPPLLASFDRCCVFVQNRYLVDNVPLSGFRWLTRLRLMVDRIWLRMRAHTVGQFIVQTETMKQKLRDSVGRESGVVPLMPDLAGSRQNRQSKESTAGPAYDFVYIASGEPHKNHRRLVEAWVLLAERGERPRLCLTLDANRFAGLTGWIESMARQHNLDITITGQLTSQQIVQYYELSRALIYPSLFESFGLPLLEAIAHGLPLLAADRDYVHDVVQPTAVCDPLSARSIADAVSGFSFEASQAKIDGVDAEEFLQHVHGWNE